ncbi:uncharacterized protein BDV14DRAFT_194616 [Aspergillus stella-maris]|uniref:uncharacterized protein n=1 Tax=Aspergillus stella-maris TaxID=1810926 RepID=UPI003CCD03B8
MERIPTEDEHKSDDLEDINAPLSPLFGFSPFGGDATYDIVPTPNDADVFEDVPLSQSKPSLDLDEESDVTDQIAHDAASFYDAEPALGSPVSSESTTIPASSSPELDSECSTKSRKRSATDAHLPDSGSDADNERTKAPKAFTNRKIHAESISRREIANPRSPKKPSPTKIPSMVVASDKGSPKSPSKPPGSLKRSAMNSTSDVTKGCTAPNSPDKQAGSPSKPGPTKIPGFGVQDGVTTLRSPHKSSESPKRPGSTTTSSLFSSGLESLNSPDISTGSPKRSEPMASTIITNENVSPRSLRSPNKSTGIGILNEEKSKDPSQDFVTEKLSQRYNPESSSTSYLDVPESPALREFANTAVGCILAQQGTLRKRAIGADNTRHKTIREPRVRFQIPSDTIVVAETVEDQQLPHTQNEQPGADIEPKDIKPNTMTHERGPTRLPRYLRGPSRPQRHVETELPASSDQPELRTIHGLVTITNSQRVQPATFKVTVTAALSMMYPDEKGWTELGVLGIPRTRHSKPGFLYFLMPEDRGLEVQTTAVGRITLVENCLMADFVSNGDLMIPLCPCDRKCYGVVSGFTVDHEIICQNTVIPAAIEAQTDQPTIQMVCHASCSIMLENRFLWADKCVINLYLEGGPEGCYECDVTSQKDAMKKIYITAQEGTRAGLSRLRITCSPQDLDIFHVRWALGVPGVRAIYWAPRIYSTLASPETNMKQHRHDLLQVLNDPSYLCSASEAIEFGTNSDSIPDPVYDHIGPATVPMDEAPEGIYPQPAPTQSKISQIKQSVQQKLPSCDEDLPSFLYGLLIIGSVCFAFLWFGGVMSANLRDAAVQNLVQVPEYPVSPSSSHYTEGPESNQEFVDQEFSIGRPSTLDKYTATYTDEKVKAFVDNDEDLSSTRIGKKNEERAASSIPIRDRIDYWLGWTGPL